MKLVALLGSFLTATAASAEGEPTRGPDVSDDSSTADGAETRCKSAPVCQLGPQCDWTCPSAISVFGVRLDMDKAVALRILKTKHIQVYEFGSALVAPVNKQQQRWWKLVQSDGASVITSPIPLVRYEIKDGVVGTITVGSDSSPTTASALLALLRQHNFVLQEKPYGIREEKTRYLSGRTEVTSEQVLSQTARTWFSADVPVLATEFSLASTMLEGSEIQFIRERDWPRVLRGILVATHKKDCETASVQLEDANRRSTSRWDVRHIAFELAEVRACRIDALGQDENRALIAAGSKCQAATLTEYSAVRAIFGDNDPQTETDEHRPRSAENVCRYTGDRARCVQVWAPARVESDRACGAWDQLWTRKHDEGLMQLRAP